MHSKFNPTKILRTTVDREVMYPLYDFAAEFAVLGYLEITRELVGLVNQYAPPYRETVQDLFKPLWLIWDSISVKAQPPQEKGPLLHGVVGTLQIVRQQFDSRR